MDPVAAPEINPLTVQAHLHGNFGSELPTDLTKLHSGYIFHLTGVNKNKVYIVTSKTMMMNPFEECIEIRRGNYKWVEIIYDKDTKKTRMGEEIAVERDLIDYPCNELQDIDDIINAIYIKFNIIDNKTTVFMNKVNNIPNTQSFVELVENFTSYKVKHVDNVFTAKTINTLHNALKTIVYICYMKSIQQKE